MGLSYKLKMQIFKRDRFKCQYCELDCLSDFDKWYYANLNVDHINPQGGDDASNLVTACRTCNLIKGKHPCKNFKEAKALVSFKRKESRDWFNKNVIATYPPA